MHRRHPSSTNRVWRFLSRLKKCQRSGSRRTRFLSSETLEKRQLLAADLAGDDLTAAQVVSLQSETELEIDAFLGDGLYDDLDVDLYSVQLAAGQTISIDVDAYTDDAGNHISDLNSYLRVFDDSGVEVTPNAGYRVGYASSPNDFQGGNYADDYLSFTAANPGT